ncbi:hypothetical protein BCR34DRAFT_592095 [Clohesyomyces aquaticus]|uniref:Uncharacterized protein n=1 Tax=Clohesyomyces aquaticus TaxID=1231657 RepID=A0A1Y1YV46_9PLEO|nr:hypothetical protein BCR34DRAFT_592095 [Clohesyomyces aquaticus]
MTMSARKDPMSLEVMAPGCTPSLKPRMSLEVMAPGCTPSLKPRTIAPSSEAGRPDRPTYQKGREFAIIYLRFVRGYSWNRTKREYCEKYHESRELSGLQSKAYRVMASWGWNKRNFRNFTLSDFEGQMRAVQETEILEGIKKMFGPT